VIAVTDIPVPVVVAIFAGAISLFTLATNTLVAAVREQRNRRRETYASAFSAVTAYKEFPYVVRRRRGGTPEVAADERVRISEDLRKVQERLAYYGAWMRTESPAVAAAYETLVADARRIAGGQIRDAWLTKPASTDEQMNMPNLGLGELKPSEDAYLAAVACHLRWTRRWGPLRTA
jgi:hypothetical protein